MFQTSPLCKIMLFWIDDEVGTGFFDIAVFVVKAYRHDHVERTTGWVMWTEVNLSLS
jgi:hypothetical protein